MAATDKSETAVKAGPEPSTATRSLDTASKKTFSDLRDFIDDHCIKRVPIGSKEMPNKNRNGYYEWQFYLRAACLNPRFLDFISGYFWSLYANDYRRGTFQIAGVEQASLPILTSLLLAGDRLGVNVFSIRKDYKPYGVGNIIEGVPNERPVLFVDDLTSPAHDTFWHAVRVINRAGLSLYPRAFVLVRKQFQYEKAEIKTSFGPITIDSIFNLDDFTLSFEDYRGRVEA